MRRTRSRIKAFTLIELMIVVALIAIIVTLAAPSFRDMILMQRLRGINAQLVTDLAFARSEAVSRGTFMQMRFQSNSAMSCYIIYARTDANSTSMCDCTAAAGLRCTDPALTTEVKTVQAPVSEAVKFVPAANQVAFFTVLQRNGSIQVDPMPEMRPPNSFQVFTRIDSAREFRNDVKLSGHASACAPAGSTVGGPPCV